VIVSDVIWDCHCHLSFLGDDEAEALVKGHPRHRWIMGGYQPSEWEQQVHLKKQAPQQLETCYGLHPWYVKSAEFELGRDLEALKIWSHQAQWIGEVGLDFHGDDASIKKDLQINVFEQQLEMSSQQAFVFHIVQAHGKALEILNNYSVRGFVHSFSGSIEVAERYLQEGILLSFGPGVLNPDFKKARETVTALPLEGLLIESDTPSHPLDEADPVSQLEKVYAEVAQLRGVSVEQLQEQVAQNLQGLMGS
jgi:TatD DNase family protein